MTNWQRWVGRTLALWPLILTLALLRAQQRQPPAPTPTPAPTPPANGTLEPVRTAITVIGEVTEEPPSNISVMNNPELRQSAGINLDDRLHVVPGFSLFRRNSSVAANPTTQGVSLRGLGSSGAS